MAETLRDGEDWSVVVDVLDVNLHKDEGIQLWGTCTEEQRGE